MYLYVYDSNVLFSNKTLNIDWVNEGNLTLKEEMRWKIAKLHEKAYIFLQAREGKNSQLV